MERAPHRGEISETNGGDALLLDDLGLDVDVCDVRKGKAAVVRVTALTPSPGDHVPSAPMDIDIILCHAAD